jgi:hypothetical protein
LAQIDALTLSITTRTGVLQMPKTIDLREKGFEREVALEKLVEDFSLYPRTQVNTTVVAQYRDAMLAGSVFPPIMVDQKWRVIDGFHRLHAYRLNGLAKVTVLQKRVANDAEFFELSVLANSTHGNQLSGYDRRRVITMAEQLGIEKERVASLLMVTIDKVDQVERGFGLNDNGSHMALKASVKHLSGRALTVRQQKAHEHVGGMQMTYYVNQVIMFIEGNLMDTKNATLLGRLLHLARLLEKVNFKKYDVLE